MNKVQYLIPNNLFLYPQIKVTNKSQNKVLHFQPSKDILELTFGSNLKFKTLKDRSDSGFKVKIIAGEDPNVKKYVFIKEHPNAKDSGTKERSAVVEATVYKEGLYSKRTAICCSVMSGCPVGCLLCGTGKMFIRNLTAEEIVDEINTVLKNEGIDNTINNSDKFDIMFMSMGEPLLNWSNVSEAIKTLAKKYPNAELKLSTVGIKNEKTLNNLLELSSQYNIGLQFSLHKPTDNERDTIIPFKNKLTLKEIHDYGKKWHETTGRKTFLNYVITKNTNVTDIEKLKKLFPETDAFNFTFSPIFSTNQDKEFDINDYALLQKFKKSFEKDGYKVKIFNPAGRKDVSGGCGQLWFVQDLLHKIKSKFTPEANIKKLKLLTPSFQ